MEDKDFELDYVEMHVDEMKSVKDSWKGYFKMARNNFNHIKYIEETKENRWDLKALEMYYKFFMNRIRDIIEIYSQLIDMAENDELEEKDFIKSMKSVKLINKELHAEANKKKFKELNIKYIEGLRPARDLTI